MQNVTVPVLILHAQDDKIVPSYLSERLVKNVKEETDTKDVQLILFPKNLGLKHRYIYRAPGIDNIINNFETKTKDNVNLDS